MHRTLRRQSNISSCLCAYASQYYLSSYPYCRSKSSKSASDSQSVAATPSHKAGSVPQYLLNRQEKWRQAEERRAKNKPDPRYGG